MENKEKILEKINEIGEELVKCPLNCNGIDNKKEEGIIPRCINLDIEKRNLSGKGVIIVGMNPGKASKDEMNFYIENKCSYESHKKFMKEYIQKKENNKHKYHREIKEIINLLGFDGPILWTEIVKCQSKKGFGSLNVQTIRTCIHKFLKEEIDLFKNFTIITIGAESFRTCSLLFRDRRIIGIQHPSSANRTYSMFKESLKFHIDKIKTKINNLHNNEAIHLNEILKE